MSEQLYTTNDLITATGRPQVTLNTACQRGKVGTMCGKFRVFTDYEFRELCRLDRMAKEQKMDYTPLVVGCFANRKAPFPYSTIEQVSTFNDISRNLVKKWVNKGLLQAVRAGNVFLLDQENQAKAKRLSDEAKAKFNAHHAPFSMSPSGTPGFAHISIDPSMLKFSITREGAKKLMEYLKQQIGEA